MPKIPPPLLDPGSGEPARRTVTQSDVYGVLTQVLGEKLYTDIPPARLVARTLTLQNGEEHPFVEGKYHASPVVADTPLHELRVKRIKITQSGVIGKIGVLALEGLVRMQFEEDCVGALLAEQPACQWRAVAVILEQVDRSITVPIAYTGPVFTEMNYMSAPGVNIDGDSDAIALKRQTDHRIDHDYQAIAHVVFADIKRGTLRDPEAMHRTTANVGAFAAYAASRNLLVAPPSIIEQRRRAEELIAQWAAATAEPDGDGEREPDDRDAELAELRARLAMLEGKASPPAPKKPGPGRGRRRAPVASPAGSTLVDDAAIQNKQIIGMRAAGSNPSQIAQDLGITEDHVKEVLVAWTQAEAANQG